jgi:hypothetical protein
VSIVTIDRWRQEYNYERPHSSLAYKMPWELAASQGYTHLKTKTGKLQLWADVSQIIYLASFYDI